MSVEEKNTTHVNKHFSDFTKEVSYRVKDNLYSKLYDLSLLQPEVSVTARSESMYNRSKPRGGERMQV